MTPSPAELPVTTSIDLGLVVFAFLVVAVGAAIASVVYAARVERAKDAAACDDQSPPWPWHDLTWDEVYTADAEGEVVP